MKMPALLQSFLFALLALCASVFSLVAAVLPLTGPPEPEPDFGLGLPGTEVRAPGVATVTNPPPPALDQLHREIEEGLARNSAAITASLNLIEPAISQLQTRQLEAMQSLNRTVLVVAAIFGATSLFGLVGITWILVRALGRFSELAAGMPGVRGQILAATSPPAGLVSGELSPAAAPGAADHASARFQSAIEQLQKRILELEHNLHESRGGGGGEMGSGWAPATKSNGTSLDAGAEVLALLRPGSGPTSARPESTNPASHASVLIGKGQALLNLDAAEQALACFEEVLGFEPNNTEALVRRGLAFERLQNWEQALESYDRAIAADNSLTIAYLYKGGVCNRLQRHKEALESYEQALQTESKVRSP